MRRRWNLRMCATSSVACAAGAHVDRCVSGEGSRATAGMALGARTGRKEGRACGKRRGCADARVRGCAGVRNGERAGRTGGREQRAGGQRRDVAWGGVVWGGWVGTGGGRGAGLDARGDGLVEGELLLEVLEALDVARHGLARLELVAHLLAGVLALVHRAAAVGALVPFPSLHAHPAPLIAALAACHVVARRLVGDERGHAAARAELAARLEPLLGRVLAAQLLPVANLLAAAGRVRLLLAEPAHAVLAQAGHLPRVVSVLQSPQWQLRAGAARRTGTPGLHR